MTRRFVGGTLNYGVGQALPQVLRFLLLLVFTLVLTEADYGVLALAGTFSAFLIHFHAAGRAGRRDAILLRPSRRAGTDGLCHDDRDFLLGSSVVIGLANDCSLGPWLFEHLIPELGFYPYGLLALGTAVISCNQNLQDRLVQAREQSSYMAKLNIGRAVISIALALIFVLGLRWGAYGMLVAELIAAAVDLRAGRPVFAPQPARPFSAGNAADERQIWTGSPAESFCLEPGAAGDQFDPGRRESIWVPWAKLDVARRFVLPLTVLASAFQTAFMPIYFSLRADHSPKNVDTLVRTARFVLGRRDRGGDRRHVLHSADSAADDSGTIS